MKETINRVIDVNIADATALIKILEKDGDPENLQRARADLAKWEAMKEGKKGTRPTPPGDHEKKEAGEAKTEKAAGGNIYTPEYIASLFLPTETE